MLSELEFGALLVYSPRGNEDASRRSKDITLGIKADRAGLLAELADLLAERIVGSELEGILGPEVVLVPVPKSAPLYPGALWPARRIADELVQRQLGREVLACLERVRAVRESALQPRGGRPSPLDHASSMTATRQLVIPEQITLVDDVVTKGATLLAGASLVRQAFPEAIVRGFALVRTMGLTPEIGEILAPCRGVIREAYGEAVREP